MIKEHEVKRTNMDFVGQLSSEISCTELKDNGFFVKEQRIENLGEENIPFALYTFLKLLYMHLKVLE